MRRDVETATYRKALSLLREARRSVTSSIDLVTTLPGCSNREWRRYLDSLVVLIDEVGTELVAKRTARKVPE